MAPPPPIPTSPDVEVLDMDALAAEFEEMESPMTHSMRIRLRKQKSMRATASQALQGRTDGASDTAPGEKKLIARVKKNSHSPEAKAFRRRLKLAARTAVGVLIAGLIQTRGSSRQYLLLPSSYYLGGLTYAATMVVFASASTMGGVLQQIWQIDLGVAVALLFNFVLFSVVPLTQGGLIHATSAETGAEYHVSLRDWGIILPLMLVYTFVILISPAQPFVKKFAVSTNLFFALTIVSPMNPTNKTELKDLSNNYFGTHNLINNLAIYSVVGVVGTLISLGIMVLPTPVCAIRKLLRQMQGAPQDIREILNLIMDAYCFRAKDIKQMDFFRLRLDRQLAHADKRLKHMQALLDDAWWEELVGIGLLLKFNKTVAKQFVKLYARLLQDLVAMKFAIQCETGHWTHVVLMKKMQKPLYVLQSEANDLLEEIADNVRRSVRSMGSPRFAHLESALERLLAKYSHLCSEVFASEVHSADDVGKTMAMNLFVYSFHAFAHSLYEFQEQFNHKNFSSRYRVKNFVKLVWRGVIQKGNYPRKLLFFSFRTTLAVLMGICCATFLFTFSSTAPTAIAMVATYHIGGTYSNTINRVTGLVAGTVVPSLLGFFVCKAESDALYNVLNNVVLFVWTVGSMYVFFTAKYVRAAGMVSAYMAVSVLLSHSCRASTSTSTTSLSYTALTENSMGILLLMLTEICIRPHSARDLLRGNIQRTMALFRPTFKKIFEHHLFATAPSRAPPTGSSTTSEPSESTNTDGEGSTCLLDAVSIKELRKQLDGAIPQLLAEQATLLHDAEMEPSLWKPPFSKDKYEGVLEGSRRVLAHLRLCLNLVEWYTKRRAAAENRGYDTRLRRARKSHIDADIRAAYEAQQQEGESSEGNEDLLPPLFLSPQLGPARARALTRQASVLIKTLPWEQSQATFEAGVDEAFETLATLFSKEFAKSDAADHAIFLQMKEAFRLADVHRRGEVDASELVVLLEKLMPYAGGQGHVQIVDQYVDEFMALVDKNGDGKVSFGEFMQALNEGFRMELEMYDPDAVSNAMGSASPPSQNRELRPKQLVTTKSMRLVTKRAASHSSSGSTDDDTSDENAAMLTSSSIAPLPSADNGASSSFIDVSKLGSFLFGGTPTNTDSSRSTQVTDSSVSSSRRFALPRGSSSSESSAPEVLLNVESFSIRTAAAALKQSYGAFLLDAVSDHTRRVAMEDLIVMSCLISACEDLAATLAALSTLAAS